MRIALQVRAENIRDTIQDKRLPQDNKTAGMQAAMYMVSTVAQLQYY